MLTLVAASPTISLVLIFPVGGERFSELWVLGPGHMAEEYPVNVGVDEKFSVFVGMGNHMGGSTYYLVYAKFRNASQPLPNATASEPSPLPPLLEFQFFVLDQDVWEASLTFRVLDASHTEDRSLIKRIEINGFPFVVDASATWDLEQNGYFYQLFFELWIYDTSQGFQFHNRFVGLWLNMTI